MSHLYIHVPFCKKICYYCDFHFSLQLKNKDRFVDALCKELLMQKDFFGSNALSTIYFGGGTPSVLSYNDLNRIFTCIYENYPMADEREVSFEANPDDLTDEYIRSLQDTPINRVSVGIQSFNDDDLKLMNRRHTGAEAKQALERLHQYNFKNISADMIYGLPDMDLQSWNKQINQILDFDIQHISSYNLTIEKQTAFGKMHRDGKLNIPADDDSFEQFNLMLSKFESKGFEHYEISNFAKDQNYSQHNMCYWKNSKYLGVGPSAHSYTGYERRWNVSHNLKYMDSILDNNKIPFGFEELSTADRFNEYIFTSLRTKWGIEKYHMVENFPNHSDHFFRVVNKYLLSKDVVLTEGHFRLTQKGKFLADKVASDLFWV